MEDYDDSALIRLAKITRVSGYRRRGVEGQSEKVSAYVRKYLDLAGFGSGKTKKGAFAGAVDTTEPSHATQHNGFLGKVKSFIDTPDPFIDPESGDSVPHMLGESPEQAIKKYQAIPRSQRPHMAGEVYSTTKERKALYDADKARRAAKKKARQTGLSADEQDNVELSVDVEAEVGRYLSL